MEDYPAYHTTGRSAAFFMEAYGNESVRKITQASRAFFENPPENFSRAPLLNSCGALYLGQEGQEQKIKTTYNELKPLINDCQEVDQDFIKKKIPLINSKIISGFWEPNSKEINVASLMEGYIKLAKKNGVTFQQKEKVNSLEHKDSIWRINKKFQANMIVNAAGAWADQIGQLAGTQTLRLKPKKRNICIAKIDEQFGDVSTWPLCLDIDEKFYFKPSGEHLLITPADEISSNAHDAQADELQIALGIDRVQKVLDIEFTHLIRQWAGLRTFSEDRSPVVGFDPKVKNFFWIAGQGGYGIQMAPALAKLAAGIIEDSENTFAEIDTRALKPERYYSAPFPVW
jgi:D-arginine dehydrogenase